LAAFLLFNQVMSVQYALWMLPLLVLVRVPAWLVAAFFVADAAVYFGIFDYLGHFGSPPHFLRLALASFARAAVYLTLLVWVLRQARRPKEPLAAPAAGLPGKGPIPPRPVAPPA
jgi:hypothetical protein